MRYKIKSIKLISQEVLINGKVRERAIRWGDELGMYSLRPRDVDWFRRGMVYDVDLSHARDEEMYSVFVCHHVLAKLCGLHVHVYCTSLQVITQRNSL